MNIENQRDRQHESLKLGVMLISIVNLILKNIEQVVNKAI